jgi:WD40 repeat protein
MRTWYTKWSLAPALWAASFAVAPAALGQGSPNPALRTLAKPHTNTVVGIAFSPDGKTLVTSSRDKTIAFWDVRSGERRHVIRHAERFGPLAYSPDGKTLAVVAGADGREVILYDPATREEKGKLRGFSAFLRSLAFSPDGKTLATKEDKAAVVTLWDVQAGKKLRVLAGHDDICDFHRQPFSPDGKWFVTGGKDETIRVWDVATGRAVKVLKGHDGPVYCSVTFSPDGKAVVSGGDKDATVRLWDVRTGKLTATLDGHTKAVVFVAFRPDGKTVVSLTADEAEARLWDVATGKEKAAFHWYSSFLSVPGYQSYITLSPDGNTLALAANKPEGKFIYLWDLTKVKAAR